MAKFKVGDKVRLKKGLFDGVWYGGVPLLQDMKENAEADGGIREVKVLCKYEATDAYILDTVQPYVYTEEMLELVEEEEEKTQKKNQGLEGLYEALVLMSQLFFRVFFTPYNRR